MQSFTLIDSMEFIWMASHSFVISNQERTAWKWELWTVEFIVERQWIRKKAAALSMNATMQQTTERAEWSESKWTISFIWFQQPRIITSISWTQLSFWLEIIQAFTEAFTITVTSLWGLYTFRYIHTYKYIISTSGVCQY